MSEPYIGFFAVAPAHFDAVEELLQHASRAQRERSDDQFVRSNDVYRHAQSVSISAVTLRTELQCNAWPGVWSLLCKGLKWDYDASLFTDAEVQTMYPQWLAWEARYGGEDKIIARMRSKRRYLPPKTPIEAITEMYQHHKRAFAEAAEAHAGVVIATLWEGAEERLAEERAEAERRRQREAAEPEPEQAWTEEDQARRDAEFEAWRREFDTNYRKRRERESDPAQRTGGACYLILVPVARAAPLHKRIRAEERLGEDAPGRARRLHEIQQEARARGVHEEVFTLTGEARCSYAIEVALRRYGQARKFTLKEARRFLGAMERWEAEVGPEGALDELASFGGSLYTGFEESNRRIAGKTYARVKQAFARAVAAGCSVFWMR